LARRAYGRAACPDEHRAIRSSRTRAVWAGPGVSRHLAATVLKFRAPEGRKSWY
jgi:hypothetical protein